MWLYVTTFVVVFVTFLFIDSIFAKNSLEPYDEGYQYLEEDGTIVDGNGDIIDFFGDEE